MFGMKFGLVHRVPGTDFQASSEIEAEVDPPVRTNKEGV
jgi:hypothetical protein